MRPWESAPPVSGAADGCPGSHGPTKTPAPAKIKIWLTLVEARAGPHQALSPAASRRASFRIGMALSCMEDFAKAPAERGHGVRVMSALTVKHTHHAPRQAWSMFASGRINTCNLAIMVTAPGMRSPWPPSRPPSVVSAAVVRLPHVKLLQPRPEEVKARSAADQDLVRRGVQTVLQEFLAAEMSAAPGAAKRARTPARQGYRAAGTIRVPWSPGSANWSCGRSRTAPSGSRPSCSNAISARRRRSWPRWPR